MYEPLCGYTLDQTSPIFLVDTRDRSDIKQTALRVRHVELHYKMDRRIPALGEIQF